MVCRLAEFGASGAAARRDGAVTGGLESDLRARHRGLIGSMSPVLLGHRASTRSRHRSTSARQGHDLRGGRECSSPLSSYNKQHTVRSKSQTGLHGDFPMMTRQGTFIIQRTERVVVRSWSVRRACTRRVHRQEHREDLQQRQGHPGVERAEFSTSTARTPSVSARPPSAASRSDAAQGARHDRRGDPRAVRLIGDHVATLRKDPAKNTTRPMLGHLPQAASGRSRRPRGARPSGEPVLQGQALRLARVGRYKINKKLGLKHRHCDRGVDPQPRTTSSPRSSTWCACTPATP